MECRWDEGFKMDYINGLAEEKDRIAFEEHLAACRDCRFEIAGLRSTVTALVDLGSPPVPGPWIAAARERLRRSEAPPVRRFTGIFQYAMISAGVVVTLTLLFWLMCGWLLRGWAPGLSPDALGIPELRTTRAVEIILWILSLHTLLFVPSIIDDIYRLLRQQVVLE